jgi:hypothetical protein
MVCRNRFSMLTRVIKRGRRVWDDLPVVSINPVGAKDLASIAYESEAHFTVQWSNVETRYPESFLKGLDLESECSPLFEEGFSTQFQLRAVIPKCTEQSLV